MALVASTIANDGVLMQPRLVTAMTGERAGRGRSGRRRWAGSSRRPTRRPSTRRWSRRSRATLGRQFTAGAKVPGVTTAGKSGTAELGGTRRAPLVVHRLRPGRGPEDRDRGPRRAGRPRRRGRGADRRRPDGRSTLRAGRMTGEPPTGRDAPASRPASRGRSSSGSAWPRSPLVLAILFGGVAAASWIGGELFLAVMGGVGCLMTLWVGVADPVPRLRRGPRGEVNDSAARDVIIMVTGTDSTRCGVLSVT